MPPERACRAKGFSGPAASGKTPGSRPVRARAAGCGSWPQVLNFWNNPLIHIKFHKGLKLAPAPLQG